MKKLLFVAAVLVAQICMAQIPKPMKDTYVNDFAEVLTPDQVTALNKQIFDIEHQSGVQFAVVLVSNLPQDYEIEDYSLLLARKWHVGTHKDGLVYVAALKEHKQRLEVADSIKATFTAEKCQDIMAAIKPFFKARDYNGGLQTLVSQVQEALAVTSQPATQPADPQPVAASQPQGSVGTGWIWAGIITIIFVIGFAVLIIYAIIKAVFGRRNNTTAVYHTPGGTYPGAYNAGYNGPQGGYYPHHHSGVGNFVAGAAVGLAAGAILEDMNNNAQGNYTAPDQNNYNPPQDTSGDNTPSNWGNWGSGSDNSSAGNDSSSSSDDSGFSGSDSSGSDSSGGDSSGGGGTSDW